MTPEEHYRKAEELAVAAEENATHTWGSPANARALAQVGFLHLRLAEVGRQASTATTGWMTTR